MKIMFKYLFIVTILKALAKDSIATASFPGVLLASFATA